jgi:hypothetical protein
MARPARRSGWRIGHLVGSVAVSALVLALAIHPGENALAMVSAFGLLLIGTCVVAAIVKTTKSPRRS